MLVRSRPSALFFLNSVRRYHDKHPDLSEQDCIRDVILSAQLPKSPMHRAPQPGSADDNTDHSASRTQMHYHRQVAMVPQWQANGFPEEIPCLEQKDRSWREGDLLVHFAGAWAYVQDEDPTGSLMRKYSELVVDG